jgi:hypothetical protein
MPIVNADIEFRQLTRQLGRWDRRRRWRDAALWLPRGLLIGLFVAALVATISRLRPSITNLELAYLSGGLAIGAFALTLLLLLLQRRSLAQRARFADRQLALRERASTAVEIHDGKLSTSVALAEAQLADTLRSLADVDAKRALPIRLRWLELAIIALTVALLTAAVLLPNPQQVLLEQQRAISKTIDDQIETLQALEEEILQNSDLSDEQVNELLEPVQDALGELRADELGQEQAMAVLSEAEADLRELAEGNNNEALLQAMREAGQPLADSPASQSLAEALQSGDLAAASSSAHRRADARDVWR